MGWIEVGFRSRAAGCLHSQHLDWACHFHIKYPYLHTQTEEFAHCIWTLSLLDVLKHFGKNVASKVHVTLPSNEKIMNSFISYPPSWVIIPFFWGYFSWICHSMSPQRKKKFISLCSFPLNGKGKQSIWDVWTEMEFKPKSHLRSFEVVLELPWYLY